MIFLLAESKYEVQFYDPMLSDDISIPAEKQRAVFLLGAVILDLWKSAVQSCTISRLTSAGVIVIEMSEALSWLF